MALKNYIAKSLSLEKDSKRSIAHNNLKLTCNIYHIQVCKLRLLHDRSVIVRSSLVKRKNKTVFDTDALPDRFLVISKVCLVSLLQMGSGGILNTWGQGCGTIACPY